MIPGQVTGATVGVSLACLLILAAALVLIFYR